MVATEANNNLKAIWMAANLNSKSPTKIPNLVKDGNNISETE